jgi:hypothetical protein
MLEKRNVWLPVVLMIVLAITRWPGLMPPNFSAVYALVFCAGVYFRHQLAWWIPFSVLALSDVALTLFYYMPNGWGGFKAEQLVNYAAYAVIFWLGRRFNPRAGILAMVGGSLCGAILFYLLTNTAAWFFNPYQNSEYRLSWDSWLLAMTAGTGNWPDTWQFFRNTLFSSALFTALFAAAMKVSEYLESAAEKKAANASAEEEAEPEAQPEEA